MTFGIPWEAQERAIFATHKFIYTNLSRLTINLEQSAEYKVRLIFAIKDGSPNPHKRSG